MQPFPWDNDPAADPLQREQLVRDLFDDQDAGAVVWSQQSQNLAGVPPDLVDPRGGAAACVDDERDVDGAGPR
jgi:hypothetical protein